MGTECGSRTQRGRRTPCRPMRRHRFAPALLPFPLLRAVRPRAVRLRAVLLRATLLAAVVVPAAAVAGCVPADRAPVPAASTATAAASDNSAADVTYLAECVSDNLVRRPASFTLSCGDANESLDGLRWADWGARTARAAGVLVSNDCTPDCSSGKVVRYPVSVTAGGLLRLEASQRYTTLQVTFLDDRPAGSHVTETYPVAP